jgi:hypothetical protein
MDGITSDEEKLKSIPFIDEIPEIAMSKRNCWDSLELGIQGSAIIGFVTGFTLKWV